MISQSALQRFQDEMTKVMKDPYKVFAGIKIIMCLAVSLCRL